MNRDDDHRIYNNEDGERNDEHDESVGPFVEDLTVKWIRSQIGLLKKREFHINRNHEAHFTYVHLKEDFRKSKLWLNYFEKLCCVEEEGEN